MSGEDNARPDIVAEVAKLRREVYELTRRLGGERDQLYLGGLYDVRTDALVDGTIVSAPDGMTPQDNAPLVYRKADDVWIPGEFPVDGPVGGPGAYDRDYTCSFDAIPNDGPFLDLDNSDPGSGTGVAFVPWQQTDDFLFVPAFPPFTIDPTYPWILHCVQTGYHTFAWQPGQIATDGSFAGRVDFDGNVYSGATLGAPDFPPAEPFINFSSHNFLNTSATIYDTESLFTGGYCEAGEIFECHYLITNGVGTLGACHLEIQRVT